MIQRKDFQIIADTLKTNLVYEGMTIGEQFMYRQFRKALARTNPNFDSDKFDKAAGWPYE